MSLWTKAPDLSPAPLPKARALGYWDFLKKKCCSDQSFCSNGLSAGHLVYPGSPFTSGDLPHCLLISPFLDSPFLSTHAT